MKRTPIYAIALVSALALGGLTASIVAGDAETSKPDTSTGSTTSTTVVTPQPGVVADGVHVATIVAAYVAPDELVFEPAELLVGDEAVAAAADGAEATDFYVRRHPGSRATAPVDADVRVTAVDCAAGCEEGAPSDYGTLTLEADGSGLHRLTIRDGMIVAIDAVYLP